MTETAPSRNQKQLLTDVLLIIILLVGAYFRFVGLDWGEGQNLHPDELFLTNVISVLQPVDDLGAFFDTQTSTLNPHNVGHGFFVYGTLPLFLTRYAGEWLGQVGYGELQLVGRYLSASVDVLVVLLVYLIAARVYDRRVGLAAAAFSAFTVLQIQLSHYFTVDTFTGLFTFLAIYFAVRVAYPRPRPGVETETQGEEDDAAQGAHPRTFDWLHFVLFGVALGMATASKISAAPLAFMLPAAVVLRLLTLPAEKRSRHLWDAFGHLTLAALVSLIVFRVFQPYAFSGPGFFGMLPNEKWVGNLTYLAEQQAGDIDWPPSIQWARRPVWFSAQNMILWGMGLPMGIAAWAGFLWVAWRMAKGQRRAHLLLWGWTAVNFIWQSLKFNPTMRYQLPVYPALAIFAGWSLIALWDIARKPTILPALKRWLRPLALLLGGAALVGTFLWAFAFTRIYTRPETRVEASRWIYQSLPGPLTLEIETPAGAFRQPIPFFPYDRVVAPGNPFLSQFAPKVSGTLSQVYLGGLSVPDETRTLTLQISEKNSSANSPISVPVTITFPSSTGLDSASEALFTLPSPLLLSPDREYALRLEVAPGQDAVVIEGLTLRKQQSEGMVDQSLAVEPQTLSAENPFEVSFQAGADATLSQVVGWFSLGDTSSPEQFTIDFTLAPSTMMEQALATASLTVQSEDLLEGRGHVFSLDQPVELVAGQPYYFQLAVEGDGGGVTLLGASPAIETTWDRGLPLNVDGYNAYGGIYQPGLNLEVYWDDNEDKLGQFLEVLDAADYLLIGSSRQWASTTRIPERYPLTSTYYRYLLGCPPEREIERCYNVAEEGTFQGQLGFELVHIEQSNPNLGSFEINDQFSEEAFTVYDHPKVFVFKKSERFDTAQVAALLGAVDISNVIHLTPKQAGKYDSRDLLLPPARLATQQAGGTWSALFNSEGLLNRYQPLGVVVWYLALALLGLSVYPLVRHALPGLSDRGYPLARVVGLLLLSYLSWLLGLLGLPFSRLTIGLVWALLLVVGGVVAYRGREELRREWQEKRRYFLIVEGLFLAFFLFDLLVRLGNPDLWHTFFGGEKPMDFSYFNAVLKSTTFPPFDPWYAGGYINYYYYGFVFVGVLVKYLGIVPAFAYNLLLPTIFSLLAMGAFSLGWNVVKARHARASVSPWLVGIVAALLLVVLGNLGTMKMLIEGYQTLGAAGVYAADAGLVTKLGWTVQGLFQALSGDSLPYALHHWYWNPSRVIPGTVITEFPWFTFLYADPHAHMIALPITVLVLAWALSVLLSRAWAEERSLLKVVWGLAFGGLVIGALYPTNLADFPTYLALGVAALFYALARYYQPARSKLVDFIGMGGTRFLAALGGAGVLAGLAYWLYQPYRRWYVQPVDELYLWNGDLTPLGSYFTHWGVFLFILFAWMLWETRQWLAATPLSSLRKLFPFRGIIWLSVLLFLLAMVALQLRGVVVGWVALPMAIWAGLLLLRPDQPDAKRFALFLVGTALVLTLAVELIAVRGDIGRMNFVFKFYMQAWTMFALGTAAALGWILVAQRAWLPSWRSVWRVGMVSLVFSAALFPIFGTLAKVEDRMAADVPLTLDGMTYMQYATYADQGASMELGSDYQAIRWLQENVQGSPVIVEAHNPEYRWGNRMTIYTGLPGVVGWQNHQSQQRGHVAGQALLDRIAEVREFYQTSDLDFALSFLRRYDVKYIVVGQLERAYYPGPGLDKFAAKDGQLWRQVYRNADTVIYEVLPDTLALNLGPN